jgi:hypothetical protein
LNQVLLYILSLFLIEKQVSRVFSDREVEAWYLGVPFEKASGDGNGSGSEPGTHPVLVALPPVMSEDEMERLSLGLPFIAA